MRRVVAGFIVLAVGCGGGETPTTPTPPVSPVPPSPAPPAAPTLTATITIRANNTFVPPEVTVLVGGRVTFVNENTRPHDITSDPLHLHTDCPAVMDVGFIQAGQTKQTGVLTQARTCGFHDHLQENNLELRGRIIVQGTS